MEWEIVPSDRSEILDWSPRIMSTPLKENGSSDSIAVWTPKCTHDSQQSLDVTVSSVLSQWSAHGCSDPSGSVVEWTPGSLQVVIRSQALQTPLYRGINRRATWTSMI